MPLFASASLHQLDVGRYRVAGRYHCWREHGTNRWLLFSTSTGQGRIARGQGEVIAEPGSLTLIAPNTLHDYGLEPQRRRWNFRWVHFVPAPTWLPWLDWPLSKDGVSQFTPSSPEKAAIDRSLDAVFRHAAQGGTLAQPLAANALERALLLSKAAQPTAHVDPRLLAAQAICHAEFTEPLHLARLAARVGMSVSRLTAGFRAAFGNSVRSYCDDLRLRHAMTLLDHTQLPLQKIAQQCGFRDQFYFSRRMRQSTGLAPSRYRTATTPERLRAARHKSV